MTEWALVFLIPAHVILLLAYRGANSQRKIFKGHVDQLEEDLRRLKRDHTSNLSRAQELDAIFNNPHYVRMGDKVCKLKLEIRALKAKDDVHNLRSKLNELGFTVTLGEK